VDTLGPFLESERMTWPQVCDGKAFEGEIVRLYNVWGIPRSFPIDRDGRIMSKDLLGDALESSVAKLVGAQAPNPRKTRQSSPP
jgi:hypothetical protein